MLICILFYISGLNLFSKWWLCMHVNFHQSMTTFLIAELKLGKKQILEGCGNHLLQFEFCKLYNLTNWLFRVAHLANCSVSQEATVQRAFWHLDSNTPVLGPFMEMRPLPGRALRCVIGRLGKRARLGWATPAAGSLSVLSLWLTTTVPSHPDTGPLSLLCFPWVSPGTGYGSSAAGFSKFEGPVQLVRTPLFHVNELIPNALRVLPVVSIKILLYCWVFF